MRTRLSLAPTLFLVLGCDPDDGSSTTSAETTASTTSATATDGTSSTTAATDGSTGAPLDIPACPGKAADECTGDDDACLFEDDVAAGTCTTFCSRPCSMDEDCLASLPGSVCVDFLGSGITRCAIVCGDGCPNGLECGGSYCGELNASCG